MTNRKRNVRLRFNLTDDERQLFEDRRKESGTKNMSHFIRKSVLEKEIYEVDLSIFLQLQEDLKETTDYINDVAKRVNQTGIIYKKDVDNMKNSIEKFSKELRDIHSLLLKKS